MTKFEYYFHELPCFNCKKTKVNTDLGWLTAPMKNEIVEQVNVIMAGGNVEPDLSVKVTCSKDAARVYLLLNYYGYSEEDLSNDVELDDAKEVEDELSELTNAEGIAVFEHEIALQSCANCYVYEDESKED